MKKLLLTGIILSLFFTANAIDWQTEALNEESTLKAMHVFDEEVAIVCGYYQLLYRTTDGGQSWDSIPLPPLPNSDVSYDFTDLSFVGNVGYLVSRISQDSDGVYQDGVILKSIDKGSTWTVVDLSTFDNEELLSSTNICAAGTYKRNTYAIESINDTEALIYIQWTDSLNSDEDGDDMVHSTIFKTADGGSSWKRSTELDFGSYYIYSLCAKDDEVYATGYQLLLHSNDKGDTFTDYSTIAIDNGNAQVKNATFSDFDNTVYFTTTNDGIFTTDDQLESITSICTSGTNAMYIHSPDELLAMGASGKTFYTTDGGSNWTSSAPGASLYGFGGIMNDSVYALGRGIFYKAAVADFFTDNTAIDETITNNIITITHNENGINVLSQENITTYSTYDISGKMKSSKQVNTTSFSIELNTPGIYIITLNGTKNNITKKIIIP